MITILSLGLLAGVPFFHAATRVGRRGLAVIGSAYAVAGVSAWMVFSNAPEDASGTPTGVLADVAGFSLIGIVVAACLQQNGLRRQVYPVAPAPMVPATALTGDQAAVHAVEAARAKRQAARELVESDPLMARELRIGRPDLARAYDDGGLVDLNAVSAATIAQICQIAPTVAEAIVATRAQIGRFTTVEEALVLSGVDVGSEDAIRDRSLVLASSTHG